MSRPTRPPNVTDDLQTVLAFLGTQWLPVEVKAAHDRLQRQDRYALVYDGLGGFAMRPHRGGAYLRVGADVASVTLLRWQDVPRDQPEGV